MKDPQSSIVRRAQESLLLVMAHLAMNLGKLESHLVTDRMDDLYQHCQLSEDLDQISQVMSRVDTIQILLPFIVLSIIKTSAKLSLNEQEEEEVIEIGEQFDFETLTGGQMSVLSDLQELLAQEWFETWPQLQWTANFFFKRFVDCASTLHVHDDGLCQKFVNLASAICSYFGVSYVTKSFVPRFHSAMASLENPWMVKSILILGILKHSEEPTTVCNLLRDSAEDVVSKGLDVEPVIFVLKSLIHCQGYPDLLAETSWHFVVDPKAELKQFGARLLGILAADEELLSSCSDLVETKILPALVTLSSDQDENVRVTSIPGLASVLLSRDEITREKVSIQLLTFIEPGLSHSVYRTVASAIKNVWKEMPVKIREDVLFPKLSERYGSEYGPVG